jgi:hypothetical protein
MRSIEIKPPSQVIIIRWQPFIAVKINKKESRMRCSKNFNKGRNIMKAIVAKPVL